MTNGTNGTAGTTNGTRAGTSGTTSPSPSTSGTSPGGASPSPIQRISLHQQHRYHQMTSPKSHQNPHGIKSHGPSASTSAGTSTGGASPSAGRRNKYARVNEVRQRHRMELATLKRQRLDEQQNTSDLTNQYRQHSVEVDIDQLLEEEEELEMLRRQEELDRYELEMEEEFNSMDIS